MFNFSPGKPTASAFNTESYGLTHQTWPRFDFGDDLASSSAFSAEQNHDGRQAFNHVGGGMDWAPTSSNMQIDYPHGHQRHNSQGGTDMELEALNSSQNGVVGRGVGRLVAHFENKGFNPLEQKSFAPPLPPRPINTNIGNMSSGSRHHHHQQPILQSPTTGMNNFQTNMGFDPLAFCDSSGASGCGGNITFNPNRIASPVTIAGESWGSFDSMPRVTSPISMSPQSLPFGSYQENRVASPVATPSSGQFGNLDNFMSSNRMRSPVAHSPILNPHMASPPMVPIPSPVMTSSANQTAQAIGGTPGFEIWRPPESISTRMDQSPPGSLNSLNIGINHNKINNNTTSASGMSNFSHCGNRSIDRNIELHTTPLGITSSNHDSSTGSAGFFKPPVPKTPKPKISAGSQFILELNPNSKAQGKAPAKPPRPKTSSLPVTAASVPKVKQEPATPTPFDGSLTSSTPESAFSLSDQKPGPAAIRGQTANRTSREQVPAEAWEQLKETIRTLYLDERKPLKEVMSIMSAKYGFQATPKMYKTRFSQWGFVKNNTEEEVKRLLSMKFQRDAEGKVSEFVRNGRVVNLGTYLKRKGVTEYDLIDFELAAELPDHVRCRTPTPPPTPGYLRSPDLLRAQELVVGNMRKAFLHCRQLEVENDARIGWPITMAWGAGSSDLLLEANFYFEARDADQGGSYLMKAFKQLEQDLKKLSPLGVIELLLGMVHRDPGMMTALCKYLAAYSSTNFERSHPLRQIFTCLYEVQQKHGSLTVSELVWGGIPTIAEELEAIYSRRHPYVARTWIDLALFHDYANADRFERLVSELRPQQRQVEQRFGSNSPDALTLRYAITQSLYVTSPQSDATKNAAHELWDHLKSAGTVFGIRDAKPNVYCYHSPVKVGPWRKRCRRRYDSGVAILEQHVGVRVQPYFEEDYHHCVHVPDAQEAWSSALDYVASGKFAF
ncbi:hypothetical protein E4U53_006308 [Claviceps sorghi]|nr:hypothetical protein E4U53_006308 [Claviceps sorghi]